MRRSLLILALAAACGGNQAQPAPAEAPARAPAVANPGVDGEALTSFEVLAARLPTLRVDAWYGIYLGEAKLGYGRMTLRPSEPGEPGAYAAIMELSIFSEGVFDDGNRTDTRAVSFYAGEAPYRLVEDREVSTSSDGREQRRFVYEPDKTVLHVTLDGVAQPPRELPPTRETISLGVDGLALDVDDLRVGQKAVHYSFDDESGEDERSTLTVVGIDEQPINGVATRVVTYTQQTEGEQSVQRMSVAEGGVTLELSFGNFRLAMEPEKVAKSNVTGFNLLRDAVAIDRPIGDPDSIKELAIVVGGVPAEIALPEAPNQVVTARGDGTYLVELRAAAGAEATADEIAESLRDSSSIDFRTAAISELAAQITAGISDRRKKVEALRRWVYDNLEKDLSTDIGVASAVLAKKRGDCTEHALLLTALARALGIPARQVDGLIYMGDEHKRFGWHEWNEVEIDGRWWPIDASWTAQVANATHLKLGDRTTSDSALLIGNLTIALADRAPVVELPVADIGVPICDRLITKMNACLDRFPAAVRGNVQATVREMADAWRVHRDSGGDDLAETCQDAYEVAKRSYESIGCGLYARPWRSRSGSSSGSRPMKST